MFRSDRTLAASHFKWGFLLGIFSHLIVISTIFSCTNSKHCNPVVSWVYQFVFGYTNITYIYIYIVVHIRAEGVGVAGVVATRLKYYVGSGLG